jgi:hypothetical protein
MQRLAEWRGLAEHRHEVCSCDAQARQRVIGPLPQSFRWSSAHFSWYHRSEQQRAGKCPRLSRCARGQEVTRGVRCEMESQGPGIGSGSTKGRKGSWRKGRIAAGYQQQRQQQTEERPGHPRGTPQLSTTAMPVLTAGDWMCWAITCTDHSGGKGVQGGPPSAALTRHIQRTMPLGTFSKSTESLPVRSRSMLTSPRADGLFSKQCAVRGVRQQ